MNQSRARMMDIGTPYPGQILPPEEYGDLLRELGYASHIGQYGLLARMSPAMLTAVSADQSVHGGARVYITTHNMHALVVTVQVGGCQSRVSLDLHDSLSQAFMSSALLYQGLSVLLVNQESNAAAVYRTEFAVEEHAGNLLDVAEIFLPWTLRIQQHARLCVLLGQELELVTFESASPVEEVTVTAILPVDGDSIPATTSRRRH